MVRLNFNVLFNVLRSPAKYCIENSTDVAKKNKKPFKNRPRCFLLPSFKKPEKLIENSELLLNM